MILATLCYIKRAGCTLMVLRNKKPNDIHAGKWNGLGGKIEPGESPEVCVRREVLEETGLTIRNPVMHGLLVFTNFKGQDWYVFVFTATEMEGELIDSPEGHLQWIPDAEITSLPLWPSDAIFMPWIGGRRFFSACFRYDGDVMLGHEVAFYPAREG
jgi:8-oxo-dGTP diphosphatase